MFFYLFTLCFLAVSYAADDAQLGPIMYTHTLYPPFTHNDYENEFWDFGGSAIVRVYDYIRLTSEAVSQNGWVFSKKPLVAKSWAVEFEFRIHGHAPSLYADGLAFWFVNDFYQSGPVFGYKDQFKGLGIFFDTFANGQHDHSFPYISAMLGDGQKSYDHHNDNQASLAGHGCEANIRGTAEPLKARVTYYENKNLKLEFTDDLTKGWQTCFVLSNLTLPGAGYLGFTASTGELWDNHDLHRVTTFTHMSQTTYSGTEAVDGNQNFEKDSATGTHGSSFIWSMLVLLVKVLAALVVVGAAYFLYKRYQSKSLKTF